MPNTTTQSHFAKMCGVSRQAISKAKANKPPLLKMIGKHVNLDHRITCEYYYSQTGKNLRPESVDEAPPAKKATVVKAKPDQTAAKKPAKKKKVELITAPPDDGEDPDDGYSLPPGVRTMEDLTPAMLNLMPHDFIKKMKDTEAMLSTKAKREELQGTQIQRSTVRTVFAKLHTIDTNQWKTLEDRLAPGISGIFGFEEGCQEETEVRRLINDEAAKTLRFVKRLFDDFLVKNKEVPL